MSNQRDLFSNDPIFNAIREEDITFPVFVKNRNETSFTRYDESGKFEQIILPKRNESMRGAMMFGFDEQQHQCRNDLKIWYHCLMRCHVLITENEYDEKFNELQKNRVSFFTTNENEYIQPTIEGQPPVRHKWKSL